MTERFAAFLFLFIFALAALSAGSGGVSLMVPDDYGIDVPEDVLMLGKFAIEINPGSGERQLARSCDVSISDSDDISLRLRYFGNSASVYSVGLSALAFIGTDEGIFPAEGSVVITDTADDGSVVVKDGTDAGTDIRIEPDGLKRGISVADVNLDMDIQQDILPENYRIGLVLSLSAK